MSIPIINMRSAANSVKGQGVGACYEEQVRLVQERLHRDYSVLINSHKKADIMHYHTINPTYYLEILTRGRNTVNIGYVHFIPETLDESLDINKFFRKVFYKYVLTFYNSMDYLVTVNPMIVEKLQNYNLDKPKIKYIPNFVSKKNFYPIKSEDNINNLRERFNIPLNKFTVLGAGQLQTRKGIFDFVETAKKLPHINFVWAGGFSFGKISGGYEEIKKLVDNSPDNINFLGIIDRSEMNNLYNACDMFFLPSYDELFPMAILEALACEKPILLRDVEIYEKILYSSYMKGTDADSFSEKINMLTTDKEIYRNYTKKSFMCSQKYSEDRIADMWRDLYAEAYEYSRVREKSFSLKSFMKPKGL